MMMKIMILIMDMLKQIFQIEIHALKRVINASKFDKFDFILES